MARWASGEQNETKTNGRPASGTKIGGTVRSRQAGQRESASIGRTNGRAEAHAKGQDHLHQQSQKVSSACMNEVDFRMGTTLSIGWKQNGKLEVREARPRNAQVELRRYCDRSILPGSSSIHPVR